MTELADEMRLLAERIGEVLDRAERKGRGPAATLDRNGDDVAEMLRLSLQANRLMLSAMSSTLIGECRMSKPYKPLRPIIDEYGTFKWCCTHSPPHCQ